MCVYTCMYVCMLNMFTYSEPNLLKPKARYVWVNVGKPQTQCLEGRVMREQAITMQGEHGTVAAKERGS